MSDLRKIQSNKKSRRLNHLPDQWRDLKTPIEESHNPDTGEFQIREFVKFLARCAAQEDFDASVAQLPPDTE